MNKILFSITVLLLSLNLRAQQYSLFNTKTMFDSFENPAQKAFVLDSSRQFLSNFFIPHFGVNLLNKGGSEYAFRKLIQERSIDVGSLDVNDVTRNRFSKTTNIYLFAFRVFKSYRHQQELGFSWQMKSEADIDFFNQIYLALNSYKNFKSQELYSNIFNNVGRVQTYHQFSVVYRKNRDKKWAFGGKLSLLGGIQHNSLNIKKSSFYVDIPNNMIRIYTLGKYSGTFIDNSETRNIFSFKGLGLSAGIGASYTSKTGFMFMANIKDLGFIRWRKKSHYFDIDLTKEVKNINIPNGQEKLQQAFLSILEDSDVRRAYTSYTDTKFDFMTSKTFKFYRPTLILSKNIYTTNGDLALANDFTVSNFSITLTPNYNFNGFLLTGLQGMYKTPNFEIFLGSDNILKTIYTVKGIVAKNVDIGTGYNGVSFYFGMALKFGHIVEHPLNYSRMLLK